MKTFFLIAAVVAVLHSTSAWSAISGPRSYRSTKYMHYPRTYGYHRKTRGYPSTKIFTPSYNSPPLDIQYGNTDEYLKDFNLNNQDVFSQLTSGDLGLQQQGGDQNVDYGQAQVVTTNYGQAVYPSSSKGNNPGLGAYGSLTSGSNVKFSQPVQSYAPSNTRLTSSPITSYPTGLTSASYTPVYPPLQQAASAPQQPITLGSGSLGITRLNNGNFALGSGSIGYGGGAPVIGPRPGIQQQVPIFDQGQNSLQGIGQFYKGF